jgi:hypothetical protein
MVDGFFLSLPCFFIVAWSIQHENSPSPRILGRVCDRYFSWDEEVDGEENIKSTRPLDVELLTLISCTHSISKIPVYIYLSVDLGMSSTRKFGNI